MIHLFSQLKVYTSGDYSMQQKCGCAVEWLALTSTSTCSPIFLALMVRRGYVSRFWASGRITHSHGTKFPVRVVESRVFHEDYLCEKWLWARVLGVNLDHWASRRRLALWSRTTPSTERKADRTEDKMSWAWLLKSQLPRTTTTTTTNGILVEKNWTGHCHARRHQTLNIDKNFPPVFFFSRLGQVLILKKNSG